eukprot:TRINITY_DN16602_c0_g1_i2.p1 TRINITY_DN16602_c0_g1~~TRINITY_DN16602_c0_g1_i2.p1  ORF type:complete len:355 (-),score=57.38 TRINITY_DN16602_c0_g1_i2:268-1332(-)
MHQVASDNPMIGAETSTILNVGCYDNTVVYRVSFSLFIFFFLHFCSVSDLTCCIEAEVRAKMQTKFNCFKGAILALITFVTFFIPNSFFAYYAWVCMFASALFLVAQVIILVDWSHQWNEEWSERSDDNPKWQMYLLAVAVGTFAFGIAMTIVNFYHFTPHENCNLNGGLITVVLFASIGFSMLSVWVPHGSIVPSGIVFAYAAAITFSAMKTEQDPTCNRLAGSDDTMKMMIVTSLLSSGLLAWSVISLGGSRQSLTLATEDELNAEDPDRTGHLAGYCYFYLILMLGSMYLSMMVTDWQVSGVDGGSNQGETMSFWVKVGSITLTIFLYVWSLLAPYFCCRDRDFGFDNTWE